MSESPRTLPRRLVRCVDTADYPASLTRGKVYEVIPDSKADGTGMLRIVDDSGSSYLFGDDLFETVDEATLAEVPCARCHGSGWHMRDVGNGGDIDAVECGGCRGRGRLARHQSPTPSST